MILTPAQKFAMENLNKVLVGLATTLSVVGSLLIIFTYVLCKDIRIPSRRIIVFISIADLLTAVPNFTGLFVEPKEGKDYFCLIQSFISTTSLMCSLLWTIALAVFLFIIFVQENQSLAMKVFPLFHIVCWGVPVILNIIAFRLSKLGNSGDTVSSGWCWIDASGELYELFF